MEHRQLCIIDICKPLWGFKPPTLLPVGLKSDVQFLLYQFGIFLLAVIKNCVLYCKLICFMFQKLLYLVFLIGILHTSQEGQPGYLPSCVSSCNNDHQLVDGSKICSSWTVWVAHKSKINCFKIMTGFTIECIFYWWIVSLPKVCHLLWGIEFQLSLNPNVTWVCRFLNWGYRVPFPELGLPSIVKTCETVQQV